MQDVRALPSELTVYTVSEWYPLCLAWLEDTEIDPADPGTLRISARGVAEVDAAGIQLLLALSNTLQARQRTLRLDHPSECLQDACAMLGTTGLVSQPELTGLVQ